MKSEQLKISESALTYREKYNFSVFPTKRDKKPCIKWEEFQTRKPTPEEVKELWQKYPDANIGIVTGPISNVVVIDIDGPEGKEAIQDYVPDSLITPTVQTPREGQHLYFLNPDIKLCNNSRLIPGCDLRAAGGYAQAPPSVNEKGKPYKWVISLDEAPLAPLPEAYIKFVMGKAGHANSFNNYKMHSLYRGCKENVRTWFTEGRRDNDIFHVTNTLVKGGMPEHEITQVVEILAQNCIPPFPEKELKNKIESALKRAERRERNLSREVQEWVSLTNGYFFLTDVYESLYLLTSEQKNNVYQILHRMQKDGLVEKHGNKNGCYRLIDTSIEEIDFLNAPTECFDIKWPLGEERYVVILPGNIIIIAGISNAGKTAYLLNFIQLNMNRFDISYFNSEMGAIELRNRLSKFARPLNSWKFKAVERSSNFADVIKPDAINVIDFLEIHDDFWKVGGMIKDIHDRLKKGIAVIAIQKDPHKEYGIGATRSLEKARLYLTMDSNKIKIVKAKNWAHETINPNSMELHFKLVQGCKFIIEQDWKK